MFRPNENKIECELLKEAYQNLGTLILSHSIVDSTESLEAIGPLETSGYSRYEKRIEQEILEVETLLRTCRSLLKIERKK